MMSGLDPVVTIACMLSVVVEVTHGNLDINYLSLVCS